MENEITSDKIFSKDIVICQNKNGYRFNSDSVVLSWFIDSVLHKKKNLSCLEIGSGTGIIPIILNKRGFLSKINCTEIQDSLFFLLKKNIFLNNVENFLFPVNTDFREYVNDVNLKYDLIFCNPPYYGYDNGKINNNNEKAIAKHEFFGSFSDFITCSSKIIKKNGHFFFIYPVSRLQFAIGNALINNFYLNNIVFIKENPNVIPSLFAAHLVFGNSGTSTKFNIITLRNEIGDYTDIGKKIMFEYSSDIL